MLPNLSDQLLAAFDPFMKGWFAVSIFYAERLFWMLATLSFMWAMLNAWRENRSDIQGAILGLAFKVVTIGILSVFVTNPDWLKQITLGFQQIGQEASGLGPLGLRPGDIVLRGINIAGRMFSIANAMAFFTNPAAAMALCIAWATTLFCFGLMAVSVLATVLEAYLCCTAGVIMIGFAGSSWTMPYFERYVGLFITVGIKLVMYYCLMGGLGSYSDGLMTMAINIGTAPNPTDTAGMIIFGSLLACWCFWHAPTLFATALGGSPHATAGGMIGMVTAGVGGAIAATYLVGRMATAGAAAGKAAAAGAGGGDASAGSSTPTNVPPPSGGGGGGQSNGAGAFAKGYSMPRVRHDNHPPPPAPQLPFKGGF